MKINFKLGGTNHVLVDRNNTRIEWYGARNRTMIVGADVTHSATGPSLAGIVATYHPHNGQYLGSARIQSTRTEVSEIFLRDSPCYIDILD